LWLHRGDTHYKEIGKESQFSMFTQGEDYLKLTGLAKRSAANSNPSWSDPMSNTPL
jgi:hypothetical protein